MPFRESLASASKQVKKNLNMEEQEVYNCFIDCSFFKKLGYTTYGIDIRSQKKIAGGFRPDFYCLDDTDRVIFVIEFKKPGIDESLESFKDKQLKQQYVLPLNAKYGVLTNGIEFILYEKIGTDLIQLLNVSDLENATEEVAQQVFSYIKKPIFDLGQFDQIQSSMYVEKQALKSMADETVIDDFFTVFKLTKHSKFGKLLESTVKLFEYLSGKSEFLDGAYSFWRKVIQNETTPRKTPPSWEPFIKDMKGSKKDKLLKLMFCLETVHILISRLILAKVCEDYELPYISIRNEMDTSFTRFRNQVSLVAFPIFTISVFKTMRDKLVTSIFEEDIFNWWYDAFAHLPLDAKQLIKTKVDTTVEDFGENLGRIMTALYQFRFEGVVDILGELYQEYFDEITRKALGEFYTPIEVVRQILDDVGYVKHVRNKRLLDPACGSGTFLVEALKRYLLDVEKYAKQKGWDYVLEDLCERPKIIGFDINPFATLMSQIRFMIEIIPKYKKAIERNPAFTLRRTPIFRTDSLIVEKTTATPQTKEHKQTQLFELTEQEINFKLTLPIKKEKKKKTDDEEFVSISFRMPSWEGQIRTYMVNKTIDEFFAILSYMFDEIKRVAALEQFEIDKDSLIREMSKSVGNAEKIVSFIERFANGILKSIHQLFTKYEDGRLLKSIEDLVLAGILKNFVTYDFIVGNPPYVQVLRIIKDRRDYYLGRPPYPKVYRTAQGRLNLYILFTERSIELLKTGGMFGFIMPTAFMVYSGYGKALREYILEQCQINKMVNLALCESVFEQDVSTGIFIFQKKLDKKGDPTLTSVILKQDDLPSLALMPSTEKETPQHIVLSFPQSRFANSNENIFSPFLGKNYYSVIKKMEDGGSLLGNVFNIEQCIRIGSSETRKKVLINEEDYKLLPSDKQKRYRKIIDAIDTDRYRIDWKNMYLKYKPESDDEKLYLSKDPAIFETEKLFFRNTSKYLTVSYDEGDPSKAVHEQYYYALNTLYTLHLKKSDKNKKTLTKYVLAYLNSPLAEFYYRAMFWGLAIPGGSIKYREVMKYVPLKLPSSKVEWVLVNKIVEKVDMLLNINKIEQRIETFPEEYLKSFKDTEEFDAIRFRPKYRHKNITPIIQEDQSGGYIIHIGKEVLLSDLVYSPEKMKYVKYFLMGKSIKKGDQLTLMLPRSDIIPSEILNDYKQDQERLQNFPKKTKLMEELNGYLYDLYDMTKEDISTMENFLEIFCPDIA